LYIGARGGGRSNGAAAAGAAEPECRA